MSASKNLVGEKSKILRNAIISLITGTNGQLFSSADIANKLGPSLTCGITRDALIMRVNTVAKSLGCTVAWDRCGSKAKLWRYE